MSELPPHIEELKRHREYYISAFEENYDICYNQGIEDCYIAMTETINLKMECDSEDDFVAILDEAGQESSSSQKSPRATVTDSYSGIDDPEVQRYIASNKLTDDIKIIKAGIAELIQEEPFLEFGISRDPDDNSELLVITARLAQALIYVDKLNTN